MHSIYTQYIYICVCVCKSLLRNQTPLLQYGLSSSESSSPFQPKEGQLPRARFGEFTVLYGKSKAKESRVPLRKAAGNGPVGDAMEPKTSTCLVENPSSDPFFWGHVEASEPLVGDHREILHLLCS